MKKLCGIFFLLMALVLAGSQNNRAEAYDQYVGTWRSGYDAYLMTETIHSGIADNAAFHQCTIKAVKGRSVQYINYEFYWTHSEWRFHNSDGVDNAVRNGTAIERNTLLYIVPGARLERM